MWCPPEPWTQPEFQNNSTDRNCGSPPGIWSTLYIWGVGRRYGSGWTEWLESVPVRRHGVCRKKRKTENILGGHESHLIREHYCVRKLFGDAQPGLEWQSRRRRGLDTSSLPCKRRKGLRGWGVTTSLHHLPGTLVLLLAWLKWKQTEQLIGITGAGQRKVIVNSLCSRC